MINLMYKVIDILFFKYRIVEIRGVDLGSYSPQRRWLWIWYHLGYPGRWYTLDGAHRRISSHKPDRATKEIVWDDTNKELE